MLQRILFIIILIFFVFTSCKRLVEIPQPSDQLSNDKVFSTEATANDAIAGIYETLSEKVFYSATPSMLTGLSADELYSYSNSTSYTSFFINNIDPFDASNNSLWSGLYNVIYQSNVAIEGLNKSQTIATDVRDRLLGEAEFLRAYCYFYLINLYGDAPLLLGTDIIVNQKESRSPVSKIYDQIIKDLLEAQQHLETTNTYSNGEKTRATKWTASALLARVYLYMSDWIDAEKVASTVITSGNFNLDPDLNNVFVKNNEEAIFQLAHLPTSFVYETTFFVIINTPNLLCDSSLITSFEDGDQRKNEWTNTEIFNGQSCTFPYKYKSTQSGSGEYYTLLRLGEQYLIRAESEARQNKINAAIVDINQIRNRAGLAPIIGNINQDSCLQLVFHERQVELFAEGGHRWFDLRRLGLTDKQLTSSKVQWRPNVSYYPIPSVEIQKDPNLTQNSGY